MQTKRLTFLILMSLAGHTLAVNEKPFEPDMVAIKAGQFSMGSNSWKSTSPQHTVSIKAFKNGEVRSIWLCYKCMQIRFINPL